MKKSKLKEGDKYERDKHGHIIAEKPEVRLIPGHHLGFGDSGHGYELNADGSYRISPGFRDTFADIQGQYDAADHILKSVQDHAHGLLAKAARRRSDWFAMVARVLYRTDETHSMTYNPATGIVTFKGDSVVTNKDLEERIELDKAGAGKEGV